jgi:histone deacetylase complex regulatory component SIN3
MQRDLISKGLTGSSLTDFQIDYVADHFRFYFDRIKHAFAGTPQMHCKLLDVVAMFHAKKLDTAGFISRIMALLDGRGDMISGVSEFLPKTYHSAVSRDDS